MALLTEAEARLAFPNITGTGVDTKLATLITRVSELVALYLGYPPASPGVAPTIEARTYVLDLTGNGSRDLDLEVYPVCSVSSAKIDATLDFSGSEETVDSGDYSIRDGRYLRLTSDASKAWSRTREANRVTFVAGYGGSSTVSGAHTSSATTITVASTAKFATNRSGGGRVVVGSEVILFTGKTSTTLTGCTRGAEGTTAASISDGATISQPIPEVVKLCVIEEVRARFDKRYTAQVQSTSKSGSSVVMRDDYTLLPETQEAIAFMRLPRAVCG